MKGWYLLTLVSLLAFVSCSRDGVRTARYDGHECPFCTMKKGTCTYCDGTKKCSFCKGTGRRKVVAEDHSNDKIKKTVYEESCPFCDTKGVCRYCGGKGTCWACGGTGRIDSWDFYSKAEKIDSGNGRGFR